MMTRTRTQGIGSLSNFAALAALAFALGCGQTPMPRGPTEAAPNATRDEAPRSKVAHGDVAVAEVPEKAEAMEEVEAPAMEPVPAPPPVPLAKADAKNAAPQATAAPMVQRSVRAKRKLEVDDLLSNAMTGKSSGHAGLGLHGIGRGAGGVGYGTIGVRRGYASGGPLQLVAPAAPTGAPTAEFDTEAYAHVEDNAFRLVSDTPLSTFSIDVDTASYSNVRRFLRDGQRPPADAVRIEELVNYFRYDDPAPTGGAPFSVRAEVSTAPWNSRHRLVRIGIRGREIAAENVPPRNLVFLVDVSGSMDSPDKLPLLKHGLAMLARNLRAQDHIAVVVYAGASGLALPTTRGDAQGRILSALAALEPGGSTNGAEGIELAYQLAKEGFIPGGINRVILATDGDFNVGVTSEGELVRLIEEKRKSGVFLTVLGFGTGNLADSRMEALADHGNGNYAYVDSPAEARKVLVREAGSTLVTIAKDVKLQVEFNPARVASYRLIGYENRVLADRDFNDDKKDAGEIGAGHSVTALYELALAEHQAPPSSEVDPLRYQGERALTGAAEADELMTVKIRHKAPDGDASRLLNHAVRDTGARLDETSDDFRWSTAVAGFGMLLRDSEHKANASMALVLRLARSAVGRDAHGDRREMIELLERARAMGVGDAG